MGEGLEMGRLWCVFIILPLANARTLAGMGPVFRSWGGSIKTEFSLTS
jgi:hypothetical protein